MKKGQQAQVPKKRLQKVSEDRKDESEEGEWDNLSDEDEISTSGILYKVLNVKPEATTQEIRESYKLLARTLHPDKNQGTEEAHKQFQQLNEAYKILSDDTKRRIYDRTGELGDQGVTDI